MLRDCLDSIAKFNDIGDRLEVIVSDNSLNTEVYDAIASEYDYVKIIKNGNIGYGAGNNRGYAVSTGKYLLFLNPDTILIEPIFQFVLDKFEKDEELAMFGLQLKDLSGKNTISFSCIDLDLDGFRGRIRERFRIKKGRFIDDGMSILGADIFIRRITFEQAGRFDEKIFMYREEEDLIKRIKQYSDSKKINFYGEKSIIHLEGGTQEKDIKSMYAKNQRLCQASSYYTQKWGLDFCKALKNRIRFDRFLIFVYTVLFKKEKANEKKIRMRVFSEELKRQKAQKAKSQKRLKD